MPHRALEELRRAASAVATREASVRSPRPGESCGCGEAAVIVFVTAHRGDVPFCGGSDRVGPSPSGSGRSA